MSIPTPGMALDLGGALTDAGLEATRWGFRLLRLIPSWFVHWKSRRLTTPGRLSTFVGRRP
ncbi:MAG: hypothetical protein AB9866_10535 [Syntrophobacteraceae bacterium]